MKAFLMLIYILKVSSWSRVGHLTTHLTETYIFVALLNPFISEFQNNLIMSTRNGNASINEISSKTSPEMKEYTLCTCNNCGFNSVFDVYSQGTDSIQKGGLRRSKNKLSLLNFVKKCFLMHVWKISYTCLKNQFVENKIIFRIKLNFFERKKIFIFLWKKKVYSN